MGAYCLGSNHSWGTEDMIDLLLILVFVTLCLSAFNSLMLYLILGRLERVKVADLFMSKLQKEWRNE